MSKKAYRSCGQGDLLWLAICMAGVAGQIALMFWLAPRFSEETANWVLLLVLSCLPFIASVAVAVMLLRRRTRRRHGEIAAALEARGFEVTRKPSPAEQEAFHQHIALYQNAVDLRGGAKSIQWYATRAMPGAADAVERVCEYEFTTGSGKSTQVHVRVVLLLPNRWPDTGGVAKGWPGGFVIIRQGKLARRFLRKKENADPAFTELARRWAVFGDTPTGQGFLTPRVCDLLATAPRSEVWSVGGDVLFCACRFPVDGANMALLLERVQEAAGIPPGAGG